jgi:hypothetical protein
VRPLINDHPKKKNGRTLTAAKSKSLMERCIALKAADFKAGVAIDHIWSDGNDVTQLVPPL